MTFEYIDDALLSQVLAGTVGARRQYQVHVPIGHMPYEPVAQALLRDWLEITVAFQLNAPWFSRDDIPFHVLDNPIRRDRAFGAPFMSAASWKGLLRWTCRMRTGLLAHLETNDNKLRQWHDAAEINHLFGNEREDTANFHCGALAFRPTWFDRVGFEVINPHDRAKKAGKNPILYEVVPPGASGTLSLLYAPSPAAASRESFSTLSAVLLVLGAVEDLLTKYGFSAKRSAGWGVATVVKANLRTRCGSHTGTINDLRDAAKGLLRGTR